MERWTRGAAVFLSLLALLFSTFPPSHPLPPHTGGGAWPNPAAGATTSAWGAAAPPPSSAPPTIGVSDDRALASARAALDARERDMAAREAALSRAEADVRRGGGGGGRGGGSGPDKNWPRCCPVVHHDIAGEIPASAQGAIRAAYWAYLGLVFCLLFNTGAVFVRFAVHKLDPTKLPSFLMAAIYLCAGVPGAWLLWYARVYNAAIKDRALTYAFFFLAFGAHLIFCAWTAIAPPIAGGNAHAGFITGVTNLSTSAPVGGVYLASGCLWSLETLWSVWVLRSVYAAFRGQGGERRLKSELQSGAAAAALAAARGGGGGAGRV